MDVDEVVVADELGAPERARAAPGADDDDPGSRASDGEEVELERRELDERPVHPDERAGPRRARGPDGAAVRLRRSACRGPPQERLDPGDELAGRERLHEVVVRAHRQAHDPVDLLAAGGEHQHVGVGERAQPPADLDAVEARQHDVEDDDVGSGGADGLEGGRAVAGADSTTQPSRSR